MWKLISNTFSLLFQKFILKKNLLKHLRFHEEDEEEEDAANGSSSASSTTSKPQSHSQASTEMVSYSAENRCSFCSKRFRYASDLREHENVHRGQRAFACNQCDRTYMSEKALRFHVKHSHSQQEESSLICNLCGKRLSNRYKLKYHMAVHSQRKAFKCGTCGVQFKARNNLLRHVAMIHKSTIEAGAAKERFSSKEWKRLTSSLIFLLEKMHCIIFLICDTPVCNFDLKYYYCSTVVDESVVCLTFWEDWSFFSPFVPSTLSCWKIKLFKLVYCHLLRGLVK